MAYTQNSQVDKQNQGRLHSYQHIHMDFFCHGHLMGACSDIAGVVA
jgi:hypothetical protein